MESTDAHYGVGCCSGGNASSGESANPRARENEASKVSSWTSIRNI